MKRIVVVANKSWEADPIVGVLLSEHGVPPNLGEISVVNHPFFIGRREAPDPRAEPRIEIAQPESDRWIEIWCLQDLMNPEVSGSSTLEKARVLPGLLDYDGRQPPDLIVAAGTAAAPAELEQIGSVVIGRRAFIHDPRTATADRWQPPRPDEILEFPDPERLGSLMMGRAQKARFEIEGRFLRPPMQPADPPILVAGNTYVDLVNVNVTDYADYAWADPELVEEFNGVAAGGPSVVGALETTLGVVGAVADAPFLYVAGIANAIGRFDYQTGARVYAQDLSSAHNIGVVLGWMLAPE